MSTLNISWASDSPTVDTVTLKSCGGSTPTMLEIVVLMAPTTWKGQDDMVSTGNGKSVHRCASTMVMRPACGRPTWFGAWSTNCSMICGSTFCGPTQVHTDDAAKTRVGLYARKNKADKDRAKFLACHNQGGGICTGSRLVTWT